MAERLDRVGVRPGLARQVAPGFADALDKIATTAVRGDLAAALEQLELLAEGPSTDVDLVALAELAAVLGSWAGRPLLDLIDRLLARVETAPARGALLFHRGRMTSGEEHIGMLNRALEEFVIAADDRGRAVTLAALARSGPGPLGVEHRGRMARRALRLAEEVAEPWAVSWCAGQLARYETFYGDTSATEHWRVSSEQLVDNIDLPTLDLIITNQWHYGLQLGGSGELALAEQVLRDGLTLAHGPIWRGRYAEALAVVYWRSGRTPEARAAAAEQLAVNPDSVMALLVTGAYELEAAGHPDISYADRAVAGATGDELWAAIALQARMRQVDGEPDPLRDLWPVIEAIPATGSRFGWEELVLVAIAGDARRIRDLFPALTAVWPPHVRAQAVHDVAAGILSGNYAQVFAAAEQLLQLDEPRLGGQALYAAARLAPTIAVGNQLRRRAIALFEQIGAERSLAMVLRDRTLRRDASVPRIPQSQRFATNAGLTGRQREVARLAARGLTAQEIADELTIAVSTVRHHLLKVRQHFGNVPKRRLAQLLARRDED
ncbi:helix-turn-helix transcriptional regulator [Nocardioides sp.]|uniref:helix-turn-helix transcriptional regulator n=1 Tax=Nocardioides sp. TaxID=35761 RepID=UPI0039E2B86C